MVGRDNKQGALTYLLEQAEKQGYVTFDDIMDCADTYSLPIQDFDWLSSAITTRGVIVYDEVPKNRILLNQEDYDDYDDYAQSDYEAVYGNKYVCSSLQYRHIMELFLNLCHQNGILTEMEDIIAAYKKEIPMNEQISFF